MCKNLQPAVSIGNGFCTNLTIFTHQKLIIAHPKYCEKNPLGYCSAIQNLSSSYGTRLNEPRPIRFRVLVTDTSMNSMCNVYKYIILFMLYSIKSLHAKTIYCTLIVIIQNRIVLQLRKQKLGQKTVIDITHKNVIQLKVVKHFTLFILHQCG